MNRFFYFFVSLVAALFFLILGIMSLMLPWSPSARTDLILLILENSTLLVAFGLVLIFIGLAIFLAVALKARRHYYHVRTGPRSIMVDESIVQSYLDSYWKRLFPHHSVPHRFTLKRNKIHVIADLPYTSPEKQKALTVQINEELAELLENFLGYHQTLKLSASFQQKP